MANEWTHGSFRWNELMARDAEKAKNFYSEALGWSFEGMPMPAGTYWIAKVGDKPVGGIFDISGPEFGPVPESWMAYIEVDDVDARVAKAVKAGAKIMKPAFDIPNVGRIAVLMEPRCGRHWEYRTRAS